MIIRDLATIPYAEAWGLQEDVHARVLAGGEEELLLLEHPPVITLGRRPNLSHNVLADPDHLTRLGVQLVQSDRGGDVTFHGPGQLVAYPIIRLADHGLSVGGYVRQLQEIVIAVLKDYQINSHLDSSAVGVWVNNNGAAAKVCAFGVRIRRGVSLHGLALNVHTDLKHFDLINPCGLGRRVTSMHQLLDGQTPTLSELKSSLADHFRRVFDSANRR